MPISFESHEDVYMRNIRWKQEFTVKCLLGAKTLDPSADATKGRLYKCMSAGYSSLNAIRGVVNVYVLTRFHQDFDTKDQKMLAIDVSFRGFPFRVFFRTNSKKDEAYPVVRIEAMRSNRIGIHRYPDGIVAPPTVLDARAAKRRLFNVSVPPAPPGSVSEDYGVVQRGSFGSGVDSADYGVVQRGNFGIINS
jgi:hypothetical protein